MDRYHAGELRHKKLHPTAPFWLDIAADGEPGQWHCRKVLRHLPGKRLVLHLQGDGQQLLCKLFYRGRDYQRELRGHQQLLRGNINTPALLQHYVLPNHNTRVILYQYITGPTLEQLDRDTPVSVDSPALLATVATVAAMHRVGLRQIDIHPGNFLCPESTVFVLDTAAIRRRAAPLRARLALDNLANLLAQFRPGQIEDLESICWHYRQYHVDAGWRDEQLPAAIVKKRQRRWRHYRRKLTRNCSEFSCSHRFTRFAVWRRQHAGPELQTTLAHPDRAMDRGSYLKKGNTATVASSDVDGQLVVIKRYNIKHWRHRLSRCWRFSRAWYSWHNAHFLLFNGLRTPQPIALIEERFGPLRGRAFYLSGHASGKNLKTALDNAGQARRLELIQDFAAILRAYYRAGISHGDMKADNFIVSSAGVTIIDLDPMKHHRCQAALVRALQRDIARFLNNFSGVQGEQLATELYARLPEALRP